MNLLRPKIILLALLLAGCAVKERDKDILRIRLKEDPTTLDPVYIVDVAGGGIAAKLYSGLVRFNENCEIVPDIAESRDISGDGLIYTFKTKISADTVKKTFERVIRESPRKWIFDKVKEFKILDDYTLQIILKEPFSPFLGMLAMPNAYVSEGPYKLALWEHDKRIVLTPREPAKLKAIEYLIIPEEFTAKTEFDKGSIDIMEISPTQWKELSKAQMSEACKAQPRTSRRYQLYSQVGLNTYYIGFNCKKFKDIRVRQGFNYAIDKKAIIKNILQGQAEPAWGPIPPNLLKTKAGYYYPYLPNKAKRLLKECGPLKLYVRAQAQAIQIAEVVQYYLGRAGVLVTIVPLEWSAFKKAVNEGETDLFLMSWWADYADPENFLFPTFHSSNIGAGGNRAQFKNRLIDKLIESAQKTGEEKLYLNLQKCINRQAPWIFLWHTKELMITQKRVKGFKIYPVYNSDKGTDVYLSN